MAKNNSFQGIRDNRRRQVASLLLRGLTQRQIVELLQNMEGGFNPKSNEPWTLYTVHKDIQYLRAEWKKESLADIIQYKADRLAEIAEIKRMSWATKDYKLVLQAIKQETELLGLDAPVKIDASVEAREKVMIYLPDNGRDTEGADANQT